MPLIDKIITLSRIEEKHIPQAALQMAQFSLLDWLVCGRAGVDEPLAVKLRDLAAHEGGAGVATLFGGGQVPARMAALVNGATSHALDYDDTHFGHIGHLSVGVYSAVLAVAEECGASARDAVVAFCVGAEAAVRIGMVLGAAHYNLGFHQTATAGAFGATVAAGRLYGLTEDQMRHALGLVATRASGLKSQFGTMGKPYNAGIAASNGVEAAYLGRLGFTSAQDALMGVQGFVATHTPDPDETAGWQVAPEQSFLVADNKYKLHACCHGLHAMIEALLELGPDSPALADIGSLRIRTTPRWLRVCDKKTPATGLEVKFSYAWLAGMTLRGDATGDDTVYTDAIARDPELTAFAHKVTVDGDAALSDTQVAGEVVLSDGRELPFSYDLMTPLPADVLAEKLRRKAQAVLGDAGGAIWDMSGSLDVLSADDISRVIAGEG